MRRSLLPLTIRRRTTNATAHTISVCRSSNRLSVRRGQHPTLHGVIGAGRNNPGPVSVEGHALDCFSVTLSGWSNSVSESVCQSRTIWSSPPEAITGFFGLNAKLITPLWCASGILGPARTVGVPEPDVAVAAARGQEITPGIERHREDFRTCQYRFSASPVSIRDVDDSVGAAGRGYSAVHRG